MATEETKHAMSAAIEEIHSLRRRNEILAAKVEVMELFAVVLNTKPAYPTMGMSPDPAWALQRELDALSAELVPQATGDAT